MYFDISTECRSLCFMFYEGLGRGFVHHTQRASGMNNLVLAYTCSLYICIFIYRLSAVRCTIMLVWAGFLSTNYVLCLPPFHELHALRSVRFDDISTSHLPPPTSHPHPPPTSHRLELQSRRRQHI